MITTRFSVTYEIVTPESAAMGDISESGFISQGMTLRDAIADVTSTRTSRVSGVESIESSDSRVSSAQSITVYNGQEYETVAFESRSIHFPEHVTGASRIRIARLLGLRC